MFKFGLRRGVLRDEPGRRLYGPVKDGLRRLPGPVATIAACGSLPRLLHSPSSLATVPGTLTILSNHGNNTPRNTTERGVGVVAGSAATTEGYRGTNWEASKVPVILRRTPQVACTGKIRLLTWINPRAQRSKHPRTSCGKRRCKSTAYEAGAWWFLVPRK